MCWVSFPTPPLMYFIDLRSWKPLEVGGYGFFLLGAPFFRWGVWKKKGRLHYPPNNVEPSRFEKRLPHLIQT